MMGDEFGGPVPFQSTLSVRRATDVGVAELDVMLFQSTLSVRRATSVSAVSSRPQRNFNPRSP